MCALVLKRGRGRPRLNESREYNDSDMQLISEFKRRPALFDRNHPLYRDRENTDRLWQDMSEILGTPVSQIKDRTTQLRNRYNIERRRIDAMMDNGTTDEMKSPWPLFDHLAFLSDHIKQRRLIVPSRPSSPSHTRPLKRIKTQPNATETSSEEDEQDSLTPLQAQNISNNNYNYYNDQSVECERISNGQSTYLHDHNQIENSNKKDIYRAFGQFVSSSLIGMKEKDALRLLEKFTKELVQSMQSPSGMGDPC